MATRKTLPVRTDTPAHVRRERRSAAKRVPPAARKAAVKMLPKSRNQQAAEIGVLRSKLARLKAMPETPQTRQMIAQVVKQLAAVTAASKQTRVRRAKGQAGKVVLSSAQAKARKAAMLQKLDAIRQAKAQSPGAVSRPTPKEVKASEEELKARQEKLKAIREGNPTKAAKAAKKESKARQKLEEAKKRKENSVRKPLDTRGAALAKEEEVIRDRLILLDRGQDIKKPPKVGADKTPIPRPRLPLPKHTIPPTDTETVIIMRLLASALPRGPQESVDQYEMRLREMTKRVLTRLAAMSVIVGKDRETAIKQAIEETLQQDTEIIQKEVEATGAVAEDPSADIMDPYVDKVAADLNAAATDVSPPLPQGEPTPEDVAKIEEEAAKEQTLAAAAPREQSDEIAEDILLADEPVPLATSDFLRPRNFLIGGAVLVGGILLYRSLA